VSEKTGATAAARRSAKGKRLGRPRVAVDAARIAYLRASGLSWPATARETGLAAGTV
jgi:hypothetical protein